MKYKTYIAFNDEHREHIIASCCDIQEEDRTFKWIIIRAYSKILYDHDFVLLVESATKDQAYRRGTWLINNLGIEGLLYWVKEVKDKEVLKE